MVIGFKPQFVEPILNGTKIHTIRDDPKDRWQAGKLMHMATGTRTRNYNCFMEIKCVSVQRIFMTYTHLLEITVGDNYLFGAHERKLLAIRDGFESLKAFEDWWYPVIMANKGEFTGKLINWTDFKY